MSRPPDLVKMRDESLDTFRVDQAWRNVTAALDKLPLNSVINLDHDDDFDFWCFVLRALPTELVAAVDKVGHRLVDVREELKV